MNESKPWIKHLKSDEEDNVPENEEGKKKKNSSGKKPAKKGEGEFYKDLENYLEKEYERVLAPMKKTLAKKQIRIPSDEEIRRKRMERLEHKDTLTGEDAGSEPSAEKEKRENTEKEPDKNISSPSDGHKTLPTDESGKDALGVKMTPTNDLSNGSVTPSNDVLSVKMTRSNDLQNNSHDTKEPPLTSDTSSVSVNMTPNKSLVDTKMTLTKSSLGVKMTPTNTAQNVPGQISGEGDIPFSRLSSPRPIAGKLPSKGRVMGKINQAALAKVIETWRSEGGNLSGRYEAIIWYLAELADKKASRKVFFSMNEIAQKFQFSVSTGRRAARTLKGMDSLFDSFESMPSQGTSVTFSREVWLEISPDRKIDKNKTIFSFFPENLKHDDILYLEFLFTIHLSGLSVSLDSFSKEKERFLFRILRAIRDKILEENLLIGDKHLLEKMYVEGAVQIVAMWKFIRSQTAREITRPLPYFMSCWEKKGANGLPGEDIIDRITSEDMERGREFVVLVRHIIEQTLDAPDINTLRNIGSIFIDADSSEMSRNELTDMINDEAIRTAGYIFEAWKFVKDISASISLPSRRKKKKTESDD